MPVSPGRMILWCAAAVVIAGCTQTVGGAAIRAVPGIDEDSRSPIDVDTIMLDQSQMRAITGAGDDLTIIPTMDGKVPVDIDPLAESAPPQCRWVFAETETFGRAVEEFHKTTFQYPPQGGLISEGAAAYRDPPTARRAFDDLLARVEDCDATPLGAMFVGDWTAGPDILQLRLRSGCGRDYRVKSVVLVEVTACRFPDSVPEIVMINILANVPG
ncbi:sensor domain-containing protein [Mycobacterium sp. IDR2000157661]|uniref:sensor domain-containing protein n=1 Tax=Mycobacterium sp. IDR2000157661 TaxID=2867005 RepID=UPI001EE9F39B|nr:sensor domain-containing protein [Mycobacterium sp. IDR2000157661]ULE33222.1 sensor domain-containing protein [Mycobacterium sp. IDR2000157661]